LNAHDVQSEVVHYVQVM